MHFTWMWKNLLFAECSNFEWLPLNMKRTPFYERVSCFHDLPINHLKSRECCELFELKLSKCLGKGFSLFCLEDFVSTRCWFLLWVWKSTGKVPFCIMSFQVQPGTNNHSVIIISCLQSSAIKMLMRSECYSPISYISLISVRLLMIYLNMRDRSNYLPRKLLLQC